jgi:hypothetical protein
VTWIRHGVRVKFKNGLRSKLFNHKVSMKDATHPQLDFLSTELPRFEACGAWERAYNTRFVSRMFLVPKPGVNKRCMIIGLRDSTTIARSSTCRAKHSSNSAACPVRATTLSP